MDPLPIFYSLNRFVDQEACIGAGSVEICRALFQLDVVEENTGNTVKLAVEGKLDTCGSISLSHSSHLQDVKDCRKHGLKVVVLTYRRAVETLEGSRGATRGCSRWPSEENSLLQVRSTCRQHG